ncbi:arsenite methyltransferase [Marivirga sp. S37H4]|uniref:Arsenite methyltransferase n=1 Tax=Marivirga aurantiaca TaxID=2802615 RepID=A0A934WZR0_9BACT|nr:arsenite methyltransferase [Marivirga aurantiaca]MBK6266208.1 arsenite methyltransferase [Marivirga aurantiaca]
MSDPIKESVKKIYTETVNNGNLSLQGSCCGNEVDANLFKEDYSKVQGYMQEADFGLGCGIPTELALIKEGDTVLDLGSGAGNDAFVASKIVGETGKVIGIDMTEAMVAKANINKEKIDARNVSFLLGDIENIPLSNNSIDVAISNCVMNLVPNKEKAYSEVFRVLKPGGHFSISDIVIEGQLPEQVKKSELLYSACISGAINKEDYLMAIETAGFSNIKIQSEKHFNIPEALLNKYLTAEEKEDFKAIPFSVSSINVYAEKF